MNNYVWLEERSNKDRKEKNKDHITEDLENHGKMSLYQNKFGRQ